MQIGKSVHHIYGSRSRKLNTSLGNDIWIYINQKVFSSVTPIWDSVNDAVSFDYSELSIWS